MRIGILGGGLSGISLAYRLQDDKRVEAIEILEKESGPGGLCRSFPFGDLHYDVGPHIIFSKNKTVLDLVVGILGDNVHTLRRSNKIFHDGRFVKYPFENELSALSVRDRDYCVSTFLNNPYSEFPPGSMLQFFLATFGEGMTNLYLRPYNEKIWKFDPAFMDLQMVERIPKPPPEDILRSAQGVATEGYLHQLYFHYPKRGGIQSLVDGFLGRLDNRVAIRTDAAVQRITRSDGRWRVATADNAERDYDRLVSTIPIPDLIETLGDGTPPEVANAARKLRFNSIAICMVRLRKDQLGDNFAVNLADKSILFHRLSKLNFLTPSDAEDGTTSVMAEVTFRRGDVVDRMTNDELLDRVVGDMVRLGFADGRQDCLAAEARRFKYAYVIYDLDHRKNTTTVRDYCEKQLGVWLLGRFGEFEYINTDAVIERAFRKAEVIEAAL
jgi:protoporphyrinogen oxidase